jgi:hypothetical protein
MRVPRGMGELAKMPRPLVAALRISNIGGWNARLCRVLFFCFFEDAFRGPGPCGGLSEGGRGRGIYASGHCNISDSMASM